MLNKVTLIGNAGKDPEMRNTQDGRSIASLSLATTEKWNDKASGERKEKTEWHKLVAFEPLAGIIARYVKKGSQIYVEGKLQTRKWSDQSGAEKYIAEVIVQELKLLDKREPETPIKRTSPAIGGAAPLDDEIPFALVLPLIGAGLSILHFVAEGLA